AGPASKGSPYHTGYLASSSTRALRQPDRLKGIPMMVRGLEREAAEHDVLQSMRVPGDLRRHGADCDACRAIGRGTRAAGRDRRIGDRGEAVLGRELQCRAVARGKEVILALVAAAPHRPARMDDVVGFQPIAARDLGRAGLAAAQERAFFLQVWPGGAMDGAVDAAAAQERSVRSVYDRVDL